MTASHDDELSVLKRELKEAVRRIDQLEKSVAARNDVEQQYIENRLTESLEQIGHRIERLEKLAVTIDVVAAPQAAPKPVDAPIPPEALEIIGEHEQLEKTPSKDEDQNRQTTTSVIHKDPPAWA